jgi:pimeloyl-ACP methyl ester carboxylesterase
VAQSAPSGAVSKWSPALSAKNFKTPTLVIHSQLDYRLDVSEGYQLFTTLQRLKVPSRMLYFPDEGHFVQKPPKFTALVQDRQRLGRPVDEVKREIWNGRNTNMKGVVQFCL